MWTLCPWQRIMMNSRFKRCFKCGRTLPIEDFYKHSRMADGHLNKCKECAKKDVSKRYFNRIADADYVEKERERGREKYRRLGYAQKYKPTKPSICRSVHNYLKRRNLIAKGQEAHHWNYNEPYSVLILDRRQHKCVHKYIEFKDNRCYISATGKCIETIDEAIEFTKQCLIENGLSTDFNAVRPQQRVPA